MTCPLCRHLGDVLAELPASITSEGKRLECKSRLMLCPTCGHLFTHAEVDWDTYYSAHYDATLTDGGLDELVVLPDGSTRYRTDFDYGVFRRMAPIGPQARVLEFGCGLGRVLSRLVRDGFENVWACDVSERYRTGAAELIGEDRVFIGALPDGPFDVIATFFVLEHDVDPLRSLAALKQRLARRGTLFVMVPNWRTNAGDLACADHMHHFSAETLQTALESVGLRVTGLDLSTAGTLAVTAQHGPVSSRLDDEGLVAVNRAAAKPFIEMVAQLKTLPRRLQGRRVFFYGAGFYAALAHAFVPQLDGIFDANARKQGLPRLGHIVEAPETISNAEHGRDCLLVCVNPRAAHGIADRFRHAFSEIVTL